jgi:hypothetical protein
MATLIVGAAVFGLIAAAVFKIVSDRRSGNFCNCGCGCCDRGRKKSSECGKPAPRDGDGV